MISNMSDTVYDVCFNWFKRARTLGKDWSDLKYALRGNEIGLLKFLEDQEFNNFWPHMSVDDWYQLVDYCEKIEKETVVCTIPPIVNEPGVTQLQAPIAIDSAWQKYKNNLLSEKGFSRASVENIEKSTIDILNRMSLDNGTRQAKKGLVLGNVQSGKTANMGALISMAADYGWNMFIILTGTIENLRMQTQKRFISDLQSGNITWMQFDRFGVDNTTRLQNFNLQDGDRERYLTCCLKQVSRLRSLQNFLNSDEKKKAQLKILIIDDEADQAGLNVSDMSDPDFDRTAINGAICDIVNNTLAGVPLYIERDEDGNPVPIQCEETDEQVKKTCRKRKEATKDEPYAAINYIAYTATPYGNFLNESGRENLYPRDFITALEPSDLYFGPQQIFGDTVRQMWEGMPIINKIEGSHKVGRTAATGEIETLNNICEGDAITIPASLQRAIAWFCIATSIRRLQKSKSPCSMLLHHNVKTNYHQTLASALLKWYKGISEIKFLELCKDVYDEQTAQFPKGTFKNVCDQYGQFSGIDLDRDIYDYPPFEFLIQYLKELHAEIAHVYLDDSNNQYRFRKGINLCIDNCQNKSIIGAVESDEIPYVRLVYPEPGKYNGYAPAFIVVGGNTLSRGLTLEGLLCTYFSRDVKQADTLMQMGRWFGYRRGCELLPRIWMTEAALDKFNFLTELDTELRTDLVKYKTLTTPLQCGPVIMNTPSVSFMRITSANKSQHMVKADMNFAGANMQTIAFVDDSVVLSHNLSIGEAFIDYIENNVCASIARDGNRIWKGIDFSIIWNKLLNDYDGKLTSMNDMNVFKQWVDALNDGNKLNNWNVVLSGNMKPNNSANPSWMGVNKISRTRKNIPHYNGTNNFNIGVLSDPSDWQADLDFSKIEVALGPELKQVKDGTFSAGKSARAQAALEEYKSQLRELAGEGNTPLMILYCIDKESKAKPGSVTRLDLNTAEDVLGIYIRIPGQKYNKNFCTSVTIELEED